VEVVTAKAALVVVEASSDSPDFIIMLAGCAIWLKRDLACGFPVHILSTAVTAGVGVSFAVIAGNPFTVSSSGRNTSGSITYWASALCFHHVHIIMGPCGPVNPNMGLLYFYNSPIVFKRKSLR